MTTSRHYSAAVVLCCFTSTLVLSDELPTQVAPPIDEQQLPFEMHSKMEQLPRVTVGQEHADLVGKDNRALQAAIDYISELGGGTVEIGPGEYMMRDSLHLRSNVKLVGVKDRTILKKADGVSSPLAMDGDFGEQQFTVVDATCSESRYPRVCGFASDTVK